MQLRPKPYGLDSINWDASMSRHLGNELPQTEGPQSKALARKLTGSYRPRLVISLRCWRPDGESSIHGPISSIEAAGTRIDYHEKDDVS